MSGTPFGRYELIELLGRGGMGEVWKAFDTATQRVVAVKVLPPQLAADPTFAQRFRREAFTAAGLNNPHAVPIHNFGEIDGRLYVDMRLIEGEDLEHVLAHGPLGPERTVKIIEQIASALNAAHRVGLVHRDVKPSNILVAEDDFAYLIDFGIARGTGETKLTATGNVVGTWPYMAPERFTTGQADARADIYALTCVLYECLTSSRPFPGDSVEQQIAGHLTTPPPRPSITRPGLSPRLDAVIATGMAKDPSGRYGTTTELARAARTAVNAVIPTRPADPQHTAVGVAPSSPTEVYTSAQAGKASAPTQARPAEQADEAWVPTRTGEPEHVKKAWAPTQASPHDVGEAPPPKPGSAGPPPDTAPAAVPWWRRKGVVIPAAVILIVVAIVTVFITVSGSKEEPTGPLDGTFAVEFGSPTTPNGQPQQNAPGGSETWVIESACRPACVATASKVSGTQSTPSTLVFDEIDGRWLAVGAKSGACQNVQTDIWQTMNLRPQPGGKLQGEFIVRSTSGCAQSQQVTFTRTGEAQKNAPIADPAAQPARVASPAGALRGRYQETDTYTNGGRSADAAFDIQTDCLRTGERCLSWWHNSDYTKVTVYSQSRWVLTNTTYDSPCENGGRARSEKNLEYPLPQPAQDPVVLLTGRGHFIVTGDCPYDSDFDSRVQRTGD